VCIKCVTNSTYRINQSRQIQAAYLVAEFAGENVVRRAQHHDVAVIVAQAEDPKGDEVAPSCLVHDRLLVECTSGRIRDRQVALSHLTSFERVAFLFPFYRPDLTESLFLVSFLSYPPLSYFSLTSLSPPSRRVLSFSLLSSDSSLGAQLSLSLSLFLLQSYQARASLLNLFHVAGGTREFVFLFLSSSLYLSSFLSISLSPQLSVYMIFLFLLSFASLILSPLYRPVFGLLRSMIFRLRNRLCFWSVSETYLAALVNFEKLVHRRKKLRDNPRNVQQRQRFLFPLQTVG